ncbi:MAG: toxin-antitoxin system YwqK family antitoxin [Saprospiraceae bacterium]
MQYHKFILCLCLLILSVNLPASCHGDRFSITELLNYNPKGYHIFSCKILGTYIRPSGGFESIALVNNKFIGEPRDTVYIHTGGNTTAGGEKLIPDSEWLIFSPTNDSLHYSAIACDYLSTSIHNGKNVEERIKYNDLSKTYFDVLKEYSSIKKNKYSGYKEILGDEKLVAKGYFKNGKPHGSWVHYSKYERFEKRLIKSEINYQEGLYHGSYIRYREDLPNNFITITTEYEFGLPVRSEQPYRPYTMIKNYEYLSKWKRKTILITQDSAGITLKQITKSEVNYEHPYYNTLVYKHGYYLNKIGRDSSKRQPLAEGHYHKGCRIGTWIFFDKKGKLVATKKYPDITEDDELFYIYDDDRNIKFKGFLIEGKRQGIWKRYYKGKLQNEYYCNFNGDKISSVNYNKNGSMTYISFQKNQKHGQEVYLNSDKSIRSTINYSHGRKNGLSISYNNDGTIATEANYINSRENTTYDAKKSKFVKNGFLHGDYIQYQYGTGEKRSKGTFWMGYRTGVWTEYNTDGSFTKKHYTTDEDQLMNQSFFQSPELTEYYNKRGDLIRTSKPRQ